MFTLSNLEALASRFNTESVEKAEVIVCEDECGCTGDCGSNWMRS